MKITWYGHAAFLVEGDHARVILDPYTSPQAGYEPINDSANVVVISHRNQVYHSGLSQIREPFVVLDGRELCTEPREEAGIRFAAVETYEDERLQERIAMVHFTMDGIRVCHMGDVGHMLTPAQLEPLKGVDVLLALAGGPPTIALSDLVEVIDQVQPRVVIPMHYKARNVKLPLRPVGDFLNLMPPARVKPHGSTLELTADTLPDEPTIVVLAPAR